MSQLDVDFAKQIGFMPVTRFVELDQESTNKLVSLVQKKIPKPSPSFNGSSKTDITVIDTKNATRISL